MDNAGRKGGRMKTSHGASQARAWLATLAFVGAVVLSGLASADFSHRVHPVALLGAHGEPNALAFNLLGFVLPGLLLAWQAVAWRSAQADAPVAARIGMQLLMLSALALAAQGVLPLDPTHLLAPASRLHAMAWTAWWVAFVPGVLALGIAWRQWGALALGLSVPVLVLAGALALPAPVAQRLACVAWFGWWILACRRR
jgi:hypothetical membrane protein